MFSGGGNDTVGEQFCLWSNHAATGDPPSKAVNDQRLNAVLGVVESGYEDLIALCGVIAPTCPVFIHGYDFAIPSGQGVCFYGLWLKPSLTYRGWSCPAPGTQIVKNFLLRFDSMVQKIENAHSNVVYVHTQGTLNQGDWDNELHPTPGGFDKIAAQFRTALQSRFPGQI